MQVSLSLPASSITRWLSRANIFWFSLFAAGTAFCLYTCVYGLRKAFAVATFDGLYYAGVSYKVWLITFQVVGYALSKFLGIRIISELKAVNRAQGILFMSVIAALSWLAFALTPPPYNLIFLFTNGVPLGLIWGIIFSYLEGRSTTEVLGAGLSVSFIFSAGFAKSVGGFLMRDWHVAEWWMPFVTSCVFFIPLVLFAWLLDQLPPPTAKDELLRTKRHPMNKGQRKMFIITFLPGIVMFILAYMLLTAFRDFRDNFAAEIWLALDQGTSPEIFTATEIPISLAVLVIMGSLMWVKNNNKALAINHFIILLGMVLIGASTFLFSLGLINAPPWMILVGLGLYMGYVPFNCIFFDRLLAAFQYTGTVGFVMYLADSFGYLGSVGVLFFKEFGFNSLSWLQFFMHGSYVVSAAGSVLILGSWIYFARKKCVRQEPVKSTPSLSNLLRS